MYKCKKKKKNDHVKTVFIMQDCLWLYLYTTVNIVEICKCIYEYVKSANECREILFVTLFICHYCWYCRTNGLVAVIKTYVIEK